MNPRIIRKICSLLVAAVCWLPFVAAQSPVDSIGIELPADSIIVAAVQPHKPGILDTLLNDSFTQALFRPYTTIRNQIITSHNYIQRDVPAIKEIVPRQPLHESWVFWIIIGILCYIAGMRTFNQRNFKASLNSVFSMKITSKMWEERGIIFSYVTIQLFSIFVLIAALFIDIWLRKNNYHFLGGAMGMYLGIVLIIFAVYAGKFTLQYVWGWMFRQNKFGLSMVSNVITTNNFIALIVFPLLIMLIYSTNPVMRDIFMKTIAATFMLSVLYRVARALILHNTYFRYPLIYLILYLCAFEISPWLILIDILTE